MGENILGLNQVFPIYNSDGTPFFGLELKKSTFESSIMSLGDKITGYVYYKDNSLAVTMGEYIEYKNDPEDENERPVKYELVNPPTIVREGMVSDNSELKGMTKYSFEFYHPMYKLGNIPFTDIAVTPNEEKYLSQNKTFAWIGNLFDFIEKIAANLDGTEWGIDYNIRGGTTQWEKASKISKEVLSFDKQFISDALKAAFDEWEIPFTIAPINQSGTKRFKITFGLPSQEIYAVDEHGDITQTPYVFRFGQGVGLKNNSRNPRNNKIVTRICGYGSERNIPYGYPQIVWTDQRHQDWDYTIDNDPTNPLSYPIYDGILNGQRVRLIKHPFTRTTLMPAIYHETVRRKVDPLDSHYDPSIQIIDYRDAEVGFPNPINPNAPSVEIHQFEDIYPRLVDSHGESYEIEDFNIYDEKAIQYITWSNFVQYVNTLAQNAINEKEANMLRNLPTAIEESHSEGAIYTEESIEGSYIVKYEYRKDDTFVYVKYVSDTAAFEKIVLQQGKTYEPTLVDDIDDDGNYIQSYFTVTLPILDFDLYACASITEKMDINMRSGACIGCTFPVQVDWEDYKKNFYDADGKFDPVIGEGHPRNGEKYPDSSQESITLILQKETETFGVIMPNIYQYPHSGDAFVVLGISLPQSYIENAEVELEDAMMEYMHENNVHYFDYPLKFDEYFLAKNKKILAQIKNNSIVRFQYAGTEIPLYVKQITVKFGEGVLPQYDITLTDDVEIVLNQIGQVTDDVSRMRVQLSELQKYYSENLINAINDKLSRTVDDICNGRITFQQGIDVIGATLFHDSLQSPDFSSGMYEGRGWRIDNLGNAEFESIRVRSFLEVVELIVNRLQAQEGDTLFTDNDQIDFVQRVENEQHEVSYILSLKQKYDGYITGQKTGNIIKGIINTLAAKQAGVSQYNDGDAVETDGDNTYFTSWMQVIEDRNTENSTLKTNQIRVALYGDNATPSGKNFEPCELMTIARWGCYQDPTDDRYSEAEKLDIERRQRMFSISVSDGRVTKYTKVNAPTLINANYGVTIGELPEFVKNYSAVRSVLDVVGEHTDWLYAQGIVVGNFIKVDINGVPEVSHIDCGAWVNGGNIPSPSPRNGIYLCNEWNNETQQYETHDVWHNNAKWRCNQHQPVVSGGTTTYYEPTENSQYWTKLEEGAAGDTVKTVTVFKKSSDMPATPTGSTIPPTGWSTTPPASDIQETSVSGDFTDASGNHTGWREANGNHEDNAFRKDVITFTTTSPNQVISIEIQASCESEYDFIFVGNLDTNYTQRPSSMPTGRYASGTEQKIIDTVVATVGTHTIQVIYTKDGRSYENDDKGWYRVLPNNIWASVATFVNNTLSGTWSTPVRWNGDDGTSVTIASTEIKYQVSNSGTEVPSGTWQPTIPTVDAGQYLWTRTIVNYSDGTSTTSYSVSRNGTSPFVVDIDNEMDSIACDYAGEAAGGGRLHFKISAFYGESPVTSACTVRQVSNDTGFVAKLVLSEEAQTGTTITETATTIGSNHYVRIAFDDGDYVKKKSSLVLEISHSTYGTRQVTFTLNGVWAGEDGSPAVVYNILTNQTHINASRTDSGGYSPSTGSLTCGYTKNVGGTMTSVSDSTTRIDSSYDIFYRKRTRSNKTWQTTYYKYRTYKANSNDNYKVQGFSLETWDAVEVIICNASTDSFSESTIGNYKVVDRETVPVVSDGEKGDSAITADLSNEIDSVACTNDMKTLVATNLYSKVSLHKGTTDITSASQIKYVTKPSNASLYLESSGSGTSGSRLEDSYTTIDNNQYIRVHFDNNITVNNEQNVVLMVKNGSVELQLVFTILGVKGSSVYSLVPSVNVISKSTQNQYTPSVITCKSTKFDVLSGHTTENPSDATIEYTKDGSSHEYSYPTEGLTAGTDFTSYVVFLLKVGGNVVDKETVNIVSDGRDGENGKDAHEVNPNILLRTIFDKGIDFVKEKWEAQWNYVYIDTDTSTIIDGKKCIKINAPATTYMDFKQNIIGSLRNGQWYTLSFNYFATAVWRSFLYPNQGGVACIDTSAGVYVDGVFVSSIGNNGGVNWPVDQDGGRHSITFKTASSFPTSYFYIIFRTQEGNQVSICMPKLEDGMYATAYMANDDDLKGSNGVRGKVGRFFYYAGEFDVSDSTHTFVVNDAQAPYFKTGQLTYHVYNTETNGSFTMAQMGDDFNSAPWEIMTNDFKYLITEAIFGSYAHFGSFIINGDWMISQNGKKDGVDSNDYTKFDANFPSSPLLCNEVNVGVSYVNVCQNTFTANKTYNIQVTASNFHRSTGSAAYQLNAQMYNGTSTVGSKITITSDGTSTLSFTPTSTGVYYLRCDMQNSGTFCDVSASVAGLFIPTFSVDGLTGKSYQNDLTIRGRIYSPYTRITSRNHTQYEMTDQFGDTVLDIGKSGFNIQNEYFSGDAYLPAITQDMLGCEINILNMNTSQMSVVSRNQKNARVVCKSSSGTDIASTNVSLTFMVVAKIKAIELPSTYSNYGQYAWVCIEKREITG